ncbi:MAG: protein kinase domain-containing protein, partial [Halanaerobiales bacterium]
MNIKDIEKFKGVKIYTIEEDDGEYTAEQLFANKSPRSRIVADIKRKIENIIEKQQNLISHPQYIHYKRLDQVEGDYCLIHDNNRKYIPVDKFLEDNNPSLEDIVNWVMTVVEIAEEAEQKGIQWSLISLETLWIDEDSKLKFVDPDINREVEQYRDLSDLKPGEVYQPPEMFRQDKGGRNSSIYSLGIIFYYLITGKNPFDKESRGDSKSDLVYDILKTKPVNPAYLNPVKSPDLNDLIMKLISKEKEDRPGDWNTFLEELKKIKESGLYATEREEAEFRLKSKKVIKSSSRKKKLRSFWRKRWKIALISVTFIILAVYLSSFGKRVSVITEETTPEEVVYYFYQAVDEKDAALLEETTNMDLQRLDNMVTESYVIERMRSAYEGFRNDMRGLFGIEDLIIKPVNDQVEDPESRYFKANYLFYLREDIPPEDLTTAPDTAENGIDFGTEEDNIGYHEVNMIDNIRVSVVNGLWQIVSIEGDMRLIISG